MTISTHRVRRRLAGLGAGLLSAGALAACGAAAAPAPAHQLTVVATNFPLAQMVAEVGAGRVTVVDLAAGTADDRTLTPGAAQRTELRDAALVVEVGDGYQPAVEAAAGTGPHVLALLPHLGPQPDPEIWLDPTAMERATTVVASALTSIDRAGRTTYDNGAEDFTSVLSTLGIDYQNTLAACQHKVMIVPDRAFAAAASRDDLQLQVVGPDAPASAVGAAVAAVRSDSLGTVYSEPPVIDRPIAAVAARTHTRVLALDTLDGPPPAGEAPTTDYFNRMEDDLARLASGLDCQDSSNTP